MGKVKVLNRDCGSVGYIIPETGVRRNFESGETKMIDIEELKQLQWIPGGEYMLKHLLMVEDKSILENELNIESEPEYFYTEADIKKLLISGSNEQLMDTLEYAPSGVIEIIKKMAVDLALPNTEKREIISKHTGFSIDNAINVNKIMNEDNKDSKEENKPARRAEPIKKEAPARRVEVTKTTVEKK